MSNPTCVVVLAAGEGTRMRSSRPKPLHQLCGRAMALYVLDACIQDDVRATVVVVGHHSTWVEKELRDGARDGTVLTFVEQGEQLGTGHAVSVALSSVAEAIGATDGDVVIVPGDTPLLRRATVARLLSDHRASGAALSVLSARMDDPTGYGRLVYAKDHSVERIVEERDASDDERAIDEVNTSIMVVRQSVLGPALRRVGRANALNEYYLTDLVAVLHDMGHVTRSLLLEDASEVAGVNDQRQLANAERVLRARINDGWLAAMRELHSELGHPARPRPDYDRYRRLQISYVYEGHYLRHSIGTSELAELRQHLTPSERMIFGAAFGLLSKLARIVPKRLQEALPLALLLLHRQFRVWDPVRDERGYEDIGEVVAHVDPAQGSPERWQQPRRPGLRAELLRRLA